MTRFLILCAAFVTAAFIPQASASTAANPHEVTIRLDLNSFGAPVATAQVQGSFNLWNGSPLADANGDGVWETTLTIQEGEHTYRFVVNGELEEFLGTEPCTTDPGNGPVYRVLDVTGEITLPVVCWMECNGCGAGCIYEGFCNYDPLETNEDGTACLSEGDACDDEDPTTEGDVYTADCGCAGQPIAGCLDAAACNYDANAVIDAENCIYVCPGCTDSAACNYDPNAAIDDNSCEYALANRDCDGNCLNDINDNGLCDEEEVAGCMIPVACNYDESATLDSDNCDFTCTLCEATHDFEGAPWGIAPDPALGETLPLAALNQPYAASVQIMMPTTMDQVLNVPSGLTVVQLEFQEDGTVGGSMLSGVVFTDIATLEEFHADDLGMIFVPNNGGDDPNPNVLLAARPYCVGFQGTPNRLGVYRVSMDVIFTANAGGDIEFEYTIDVALTVQSIVPGCTDEAACNYDSEATQNDGSCDFTSCLSFGCTDPDACNFDPSANFDNGTCADLDACGVCDGPGAILACGCSDIPQGACDCDGNQLDAIGVCGGTCTEDSNNNGVCDILEATGCTDEAACNYDASAFTDDGSCLMLDECGVCGGPGAVEACGCDPIAEGACDCDGNQLDAIGVCGGDCEADSNNNGLCDALETLGCTLENACDFNESATFDDGSCEFFSCVIVGCTDPNACNYDAEANFDSGACLYDSGCDEEILGCTYISAQKFDPAASLDDGTCNFVGPCDYLEYDGNNDGFVGSADLLELLTEFGLECDIFD